MVRLRNVLIASILAASASAVPYASNNRRQDESLEDKEARQKDVEQRSKFLRDAKDKGLTWAAKEMKENKFEVYQKFFEEERPGGQDVSLEQFEEYNQTILDEIERVKEGLPEVYGHGWVFPEMLEPGRVPMQDGWPIVSVDTPKERVEEIVKDLENILFLWEFSFGLAKPWDDYVERWLEQEQHDLKDAGDLNLRWQLCGDEDKDIRLRSKADAEAHMDMGRYIWEIDNFISNLDKEKMKSGEDVPWLEAYAMHPGWLPDGQSSASGADTCRNIRAGGCDIMKDKSCTWFWDNSSAHSKRVAYWIFATVRGCSIKMKSLSAKFQEDTMMEILSLEELNKDFDKPVEPDDEFWKWYSFALGMVTPALGKISVKASPSKQDPKEAAEKLDLSNEIEAGGFLMNIIQTAAEEMGHDAPEGIGTMELSSALGKMFSHTMGSYEKTLQTVLGHQKHIDDWDKLPAARGDGNLKTPIGKFLNNGLWLLPNDDSALDELAKLAATNVRQKLIDIKLAGEHYRLTLDERSTIQKCDKRGDLRIDYEGGEKCFRLYKIPCHEHERGKCDPEPASDDIYEKLDKWGMGGDALTMYYRHLLDCYKSEGNGGEITDGGIPHVGEVPQCYFNLQTQKIVSPSASGCTGNRDHCLPSGMVANWKYEDLQR